MPSSTPALCVAPTSAMSPALLRDIRSLLDRAFPDDFSDDDWAHALGGVHVWLARGHEVISHASLIERTLVCDGTRLDVGYVEAVATAPGHRRRGHGSAVMRGIGALLRTQYSLGALSTSAHAFYASLGWERWRGRTLVQAASGGASPTPDDDGGIMVLRTPQSPSLDLDGDILCDWRPGAVW